MGRLASSVDFVDPLLNTGAQQQQPTSVVSSTVPPTIIDLDVVNHYPQQQLVSAAAAATNNNNNSHQFAAAAATTTTTSNSIQNTTKGDDDTARKTPIITEMHNNNSLPRSVRWRLNLQLLVSPPPTSLSFVAAMAVVHNDDDDDDDTTAAAAAAVDAAAIMQLIVNVNTDTIQSQRERYMNIEKEYYWNCCCDCNTSTPTNNISNVHDNNNDDVGPSTVMESSSSQQQRLAPQAVPLGDDPLSAAAASFIHHREEEQQQYQQHQQQHSNKRETTNSLDQNNSNTSPSSSRWSEFYKSRELINLIYIDIHRLPCDHNSNSSNKKERGENIVHLLYLYAKLYPNIGYRQGMHEIVSYILYVFEMDYHYLITTNDDNNNSQDSSSSSSSSSSSNSSNVKDDGFSSSSSSSTTEMKKKLVNTTGTNLLLDSKYILHDTFAFFECIMSSLVHAYDVVLPLSSTTTTTTTLPSSSLLVVPKVIVSPMQDMTVSILDQIRCSERGGGKERRGGGGGEELYNYLLYTVPVPPQLYISKWIRLMFTREIAGSGSGGNIPMVLNLWDEFFDVAASQCLTSSSISISIALLNVLKTAACGMILLIQHELLVVGQQQGGGGGGGLNNQEESNINLLMNYPPIQDIQPLVDIIRTNTRSGQYGTNVEEEELLPSSPLKEFHDPLGIIQRSVLHDPSSYCANNNITENYFIGHSNISSCSSSSNRNEQNNYSNNNDEYSRLHRPTTTATTTTHPIQIQDVAESLGNIAEGLLHFGTRAASSAIAKAKEQYEVHIDSKAYYKQFSHGHRQQQQQQYDHHYHHRPLQQSDNSITGFSSSHPTARGEDTISIAYRPREEGVPNQQQQQQQQQQSDVNLMTNVIVDKIAIVGLEEREETMIQGEGSSGSNSSRISNQKPPHELASLLEQSVSTLMNYYNSRRSNMSDEIFDAIVTINLVKKELLLLHQSTT